MKYVVDSDRLAAAIMDHLLGDHHKRPWMPTDCAKQVLEASGAKGPPLKIERPPLAPRCSLCGAPTQRVNHTETCSVAGGWECDCGLDSTQQVGIKPLTGGKGW